MSGPENSGAAGWAEDLTARAHQVTAGRGVERVARDLWRGGRCMSCDPCRGRVVSFFGTM